MTEQWNTPDGDTHQQKIRVAYLPPEGTNIPEEEEPASHPQVQPSGINPEVSSQTLRETVSLTNPAHVLRFILA